MTEPTIDHEYYDVRQLALDRLMRVAGLRARLRHRQAGNAPWSDARQGQGRVLALLKLKPEITQRELTYLLGMSRQSVAELLAKLERQGLIERQPSSQDRRVAVIRLTQTGQDAQQAGQHRPDDIMLDCLDDNEVAQLAEYLGRIIEHLEEQVGEGTDERRQVWQEFIGGRPHRRGRHPGFPGFPGAPDPRFGPRPRPGTDPGFPPGPEFR